MRYLILFALVLTGIDSSAIRFYVRANASGNGNGLSWQAAFNTIEQALTAAIDGDEIWIAQGSYVPPGNQTDPYFLSQSVAIYGGFAGNEVNLQQRNITLNVTTIDGESPVSIFESKRQLLKITSLGKVIVIDGIVFAGTASPGAVLFEEGSAIEMALPNTMTLRNCYFFNNRTNSIATVRLSGSAGTPLTVVNCIFESNLTGGNIDTYGGALYLYGGSNATALVDRCQFTKNARNGVGGAAIYSDVSSFCEIRTSTFTQNTVSSWNNAFAGICARSPMRVTHCTFSANTVVAFTQPSPSSQYSGAIGYPSGNYHPPIEVYNSILWGNIEPQINNWFNQNNNLTLEGNIIQGYGYGSNTNSDPKLVCPSIGNVNLAPGSIARNTALQQHTTGTIDVYGAPRNLLGGIDIGAVEMANTAKPIVYVKKGNAFVQSGRTWATAVAELGSIDMATTSEVDFWVSSGIYGKVILDAVFSNPVFATNFELCHNCNLIGGFVGDELLESQNPDTGYTTLSGLFLPGPLLLDKATPVILRMSNTGNHHLKNVRFSDGGANFVELSSSGVQALGGAMAPVTIENCGNVDFERCVFENNKSIGFAGAVHAVASQQLIFNNCQFSENTSVNQAGALYVSDTDLTLLSSTFTSNLSGNGGAVTGVFSNTGLGDCVFNDNVTENGGAALHFSDNSSLAVLRSSFFNNASPSNESIGNSTITTLNNTDLDLANCLIHSNSGWSSLRVSTGTINIINSTIAHNTATNAVIHAGGGATTTTYTMRNSILWNPGYLNRQYLTPLTITIGHNVMQNEVFPATNPNFISNTDPYFVSPATGDFRLQSFSGAINTGSNGFVFPASPDVDGNPRIIDGTVDRGAYERVNGCIPDNDECHSAAPLTLDSEVFGSNRCASAGSDPISSCNVNIGKTVWYSFTAPEDGLATVTTSNVTPDTDFPNFNMKQTIYTGSCTNLTEVECTNVQGANEGEVSALSNLTPGNTYYIRIEGVNQQEGSYNVLVSTNNTPICVGDFNNDLTVNSTDLLIFLSAFGSSCSACLTDLDGDDNIAVSDLLIFLSVLGQVCN